MGKWRVLVGRFQPPPRSYLVVFLPMLGLMTERWLSSQAWWQGTDLDFWSMIIVAFVFGLFFDDLWNHDSWIRKNFRILLEFYVVEFFDTPLRDNGEFSWLELTLRLRLLRGSNNVKFVIRAYSCMNKKTASQVFVLSELEIGVAAKDKLVEFVVGIIPVANITKIGKPQMYQTWGPNPRISGDAENMRTLFSGSDNMIQIEGYRDGKLSQSESIFFAVNDESGSDYGRLFVVRETTPVKLVVGNVTR